MVPELVKPIEILLVEDNPGDVRLTQEALREAKVINNLTIAKDGMEALAYLRRQGPYAHAPRPHLILLDLNLPKRDGREVLAEIKADESLKRIPVVVLTTSQDEQDILKSYNLHANCYVTKPVDLDQFIRVVRSIEDFWLGMVSTMAEANIHILLVEDNPGDARLLRALLEEVAPRRFTFTQAGRLSEATSRLKAGGIDLILLDLSLPDSQGFATLAAIRQAIMHTPIVVLTGLEDEALGLQLIQQGAQDYLVKRQVTGPLLQRSLRYALERARMAAELRQKSTLLQSVLDSIADGVVVADHTGEFQVWNPAAGRIIGSGPSDVGISKWSSHFGLFLPDGTTPYPPEELPLVRAIRGESLNDVILLLKNDHRPDGRWLSVNARPLRGASGHIKGGVAVFRDITTQQKTEDALRESQERFQAIMNNSPILIFLKDASGRYLQINRKTEETIQLSDRDVRGKTDEELFPANQVSNWQAHDRQVLTTGLPMEFEESATHPDGPHTYMVVKFPLFNARRECDAVCGMATDITVRKRIEEERSRRALRLIRQQSALTDFTRNRIFQRSDLPGTLRHITELVARTLQIERVGLWRYNGPRDALHCIDQYELSRDRHLEGTPIPVAS
ncbi:MAG: response regulator, partial [Nitrospira sp.]|nr:response regulator [Nitrospira sp.]